MNECFFSFLFTQETNKLPELMKFPWIGWLWLQDWNKKKQESILMLYFSVLKLAEKYERNESENVSKGFKHEFYSTQTIFLQKSLN